jgi:hypothetical protein
MSLAVQKLVSRYLGTEGTVRTVSLLSVFPMNRNAHFDPRSLTTKEKG